MAMIINRRRLARISGLLIILIVVWLLWSGMYKPILLGLGAFSCLLTVYIAHRVGFFSAVSGLHIIHRLPRYWAWLMVEIVKSSIDVARMVISPSLPISPTVVDIKAEPTGPIGQATLGNAITLSPGTVTLDVHDGYLKVHCLSIAGAEELKSGVANRRTAALTKS